jgi:hypothetical protein
MAKTPTKPKTVVTPLPKAKGGPSDLPKGYLKALAVLEEAAAKHTGTVVGEMMDKLSGKMKEVVASLEPEPEPVNVWPTLPELTEEEKVILSGDWDLVPGAELFKDNLHQAFEPVPCTYVCGHCKSEFVSNHKEATCPQCGFTHAHVMKHAGPLLYNAPDPPTGWTKETVKVKPMADTSGMSTKMSLMTAYIEHHGCTWEMDYSEKMMIISHKNPVSEIGSVKVALDNPDAIVSSIKTAVGMLTGPKTKGFVKPPNWTNYPASHEYGAGIQHHQIAHKPAEKWQVPKSVHETKGYAGEKPEFLDTKTAYKNLKSLMEVPAPWEMKFAPLKKCCCGNAIGGSNPFCPMHGVKGKPKGVMSDLIESFEEVAKKKVAEEPNILNDITHAEWPEWYQYKCMPWYSILNMYSNKMYVQFETYHDAHNPHKMIEYLWELAVVSAYECGVGKHGETKLVGLMRKHIKTVFPSVTYVQLIAAFKRMSFAVSGIENVFTNQAIQGVRGKVTIHADFPEHVRNSLTCALDPKSNLQADTWPDEDHVEGDVWFDEYTQELKIMHKGMEAVIKPGKMSFKPGDHVSMTVTDDNGEEVVSVVLPPDQVKKITDAMGGPDSFTH